MSDFHVQQLKAVETKFAASRVALEFAYRNWQKHSGEKEFTNLVPSDLQKASTDIEAVYFVHLCAVFEGVLRAHLAENHAQVRLRRDTKVSRILFEVRRADALQINPALLIRLEDIQAYRNYLAHGRREAVTRILFRDAASALNTFVAKLPAPRL